MSKEDSEIPLADGDELISQSEKPQTKIGAVREQLRKNPQVYFAGELHEYHSGAPEYGYWTETVNIIVAPTDPLFDAAKLNEFMDSLITDVELSSRDGASSRSDGGLGLGKLYFDETIGHMSKVIEITIETTEPETIKRANRNVGKSQKNWEAKMQRRTWVRVYPDPISAATVYDYETGVAEGKVDPDNTHGYAQHWLEGEQVQLLKDQYNKSRKSKVKKFLQGN